MEDMPRYLSLMGGRMMDLISMGNRGSVLPARTIDASWAATHAALSTRLMHMPMSSSAVALPICPPRKQQPGHIVRGLPTPAYLSSGEDAADDHVVQYCRVTWFVFDTRRTSSISLLP